MKCAHDGWGMYADEHGPTPPPAQMVEGVCGHQLECPTCKLRMHVYPCEHRLNSTPPLSYRVAVNGPLEVR